MNFGKLIAGGALFAALTATASAAQAGKDLDAVKARGSLIASVCVPSGSTTELNLADFARANKLTIKPVVIEDMDQIRQAFFAGRCDVYTGDSSPAIRPANPLGSQAPFRTGCPHSSGRRLAFGLLLASPPEVTLLGRVINGR